MSRVFYHSDWHFNHTFVAGTRGFATSEEHDERLIESINSVVTKRDHLWVLGDLAMGSLTEALKKVQRVNGVKHLVYGNHDGGHPMHRGSHSKMRRYFEAFESVHLHEEHRLGGRKVLLSHFPYDGDHTDQDRHSQWRLRDEGSWLIHGHVHGAWGRKGRQINMGVDFNQKPVVGDQLVEAIDYWESIAD